MKNMRVFLRVKKIFTIYYDIIFRVIYIVGSPIMFNIQSTMMVTRNIWIVNSTVMMASWMSLICFLDSFFITVGFNCG